MTPRILFAAAVLSLALSAPALAATADPDPTFNGTGLLHLDQVGMSIETGVAVQPDGKLVVVGEGTNSDFDRIRRLNPDGTPDLDFGDRGLVTIDTPGTEHLLAVLVQSDGKLLVGGSSGRNAVLYRFTAAGSPDQGFGDGGRVTLTPAGGDTELVLDLAERDGKLVAVGQTVGNTTKAAVWKRNVADGSADGSRTIAIGDNDVAGSVAIQPDGRILVAGKTNLRNDGFVARMNANLGPDATFHGGAVTLDAGAVESAQSLVLQPDGKIVVLGSASVLTRIMVTRLTVGGDPDPAFNGNGMQFLDTGLFDSPTRLLLQPDGKLVIVAATDLNADASFFRLLTDGTPDDSFDGDGLKTFDGGGTDTTSDAALQPDGDVVAVGASSGDGIVMRILGDPLPLTVDTAGSGKGSVTSTPAGIDCGVKCTASFDVGATVTLKATPAPGSRFTGWTGCAATGATCTIALHKAAAVTASFTAVAVTTGNGGGTGTGTGTGTGGAGPAGTPPGDTTAPRIGGAKLTSRRFAVSSRRTAVVASGTGIRFTLSETAATTIAIQRGGRTVLTLMRPHTIGGENVIGFTGRTSRTKLRPGRYRMLLLATDAAGNRSAPVALSFTIVRDTVSRR